MVFFRFCGDAIIMSVYKGVQMIAKGFVDPASLFMTAFTQHKVDSSK